MATTPLQPQTSLKASLSLASIVSMLSTPHQRNLTIPEGCMVLEMSSLGFVPWNNSENIISQETEQLFDTVVGTVCLPVLFLLSVPCNILNMLAFWTQGLKERINLCLFYLSLVDFLHMFNNFMFNVDRIRHPFSLSTRISPEMEFFINNYLMGFVRGFTWLSGFISMLIASERCLCVVSPLRSQTFLKTRATAVILLIATMLILTGSCMTLLVWDLICVFDPATNTTSQIVYTRKFYAQNKAHLDVLFFFVATLQPFFYVTVVSATTIVTSVKLKAMMAWREQTSSSTMSSREVALTRMLIAVSILYLLCSLPTIVSGICVLFLPGISFDGRYKNFASLLISMMELASFVNATFNFFVYSFMGTRFRDTLWDLLCCKALLPSSKKTPVK